MKISNGLTFDDVILRPKYSELDSRTSVSLRTSIGNSILLEVPILSAPMDTVTEGGMAAFMANMGGMGFVHRYNSIAEQVSEVAWATDRSKMVGAAVGVNGDAWERTIAVAEAGASAICLDIAHGHNKTALSRISQIKEKFPELTVISGNIATAKAALDCTRAGADAVRVGIGSGAACTTRIVSGVGVPQLTAIDEVADATDVTIIADGGIRSSADVVKALAAGADVVMLGGLLAPYLVAAGKIIYEEVDTPALPSLIHGIGIREGMTAEEAFKGEFEEVDLSKSRRPKKYYRGMASNEALSEFKGDERFTPEGESFLIDLDYAFEDTFIRLVEGIKTGFAYLGAKTIFELQSNAEFMVLTFAGQKEGTSHYGR